MKLAAKIALGFGALITLFLSVLIYQVFLIDRMQSINRDLSSINFRAATASLQLLRDLEQVEEFTRKYFATEGDPGYGARMQEMREAFAEILEELRSLPLSAGEREEIAQLDHLWSQLLESVSRQEKAFRAQNSSQIQAALNDQLELLDAVRIQAQSVSRVTRVAIESQAAEAARAGQGAERISWTAAVIGLLVSLLVSVWIVRSISSSLKQLTEGTRAVAEGKFFYQLDTSGNDELADLARDFNTMTRRLGELDEMKKDFVSHVSHELKNPLASIQEMIRLLLEQIPGPLSEQQKHLLELSLHSSRRLSSMIGNLLDLSRMEAGVMEYRFQKHDLGELIRTSLEELEVQAQEKGVKIQGQLPEDAVAVECDGERIIQVVGNLLANALKFSPPSSVIRVRLSQSSELPGNVPGLWQSKLDGASRPDAYALFAVSDSGPGIPDHEKERVFEKFHQVRVAREGSRERRASTASLRLVGGRGVGLGLAIGRTIVDAHRGAIWVEDNPGGGSVFYVLLATGRVAEPSLSPVSSPI